jgi:hypothetical protein
MEVAPKYSRSLLGLIEFCREAFLDIVDNIYIGAEALNISMACRVDAKCALLPAFAYISSAFSALSDS